MKRSGFKRKACGDGLGPARLTVKLRKCKVCRSAFVPRSMTHKACKPECAEILGQREAEKERLKAKRLEAASDRARRERLKTRSDFMKEAQRAFNAYVRLRDAGRPCICCGLALGADEPGGAYDCGHYRSVGSAPHLRFDERNAHAQRKQCNRYGAGRAVEYRRGLVERYGLPYVEALEADQEPRKYTAGDLIAIRDTYKAKVKQLKKERQ